MEHRSPVASPARSCYGLRWFLVLFGGLSWLSLGCNPQSLSMLLLPFNDNKKDPDFKLFATDKEVNLVILSNFTHAQFQPDLMPVDRELADSVASALRKRCQDNKHALKIVPQAEVRSFYQKQLSEGDVAPLEIGKNFKADYVLELSIDSFGLYQKGSYPKMFRGTAQITANLYKMKVKHEDPLVFTKHYRPDFAGSRGVPMEVGNSNPADFRRIFMTRISRDISRSLIAFPLDELKEWD